MQKCMNWMCRFYTVSTQSAIVSLKQSDGTQWATWTLLKRNECKMRRNFFVILRERERERERERATDCRTKKMECVPWEKLEKGQKVMKPWHRYWLDLGFAKIPKKCFPCALSLVGDAKTLKRFVNFKNAKGSIKLVNHCTCILHNWDNVLDLCLTQTNENCSGM